MIRSLAGQCYYNSRYICVWRSRDLVGNDKCSLEARTDVYSVETDVTEALHKAWCSKFTRHTGMAALIENREG